MDELTRLLMLVGVAGVAVTLLAGIARWRNDEGRRIKRGLKAVLKGDTHGFLPALGRGRGIGFNFTSNKVAVVWDAGAWGLVYGLDELVGAEAIVDGVVVGRVHRGEQRIALNAFEAAERVALRLVFDDLGHPDFLLDLWLPEDEGLGSELPPAEAIAEANRWLARIEALLRRPLTTPRPAPAAVSAPTATHEDAEPEDAAPKPAPEPQLGPAARGETSLTPLFARLANEHDDEPPAPHFEGDRHEHPPWEDEPEAAEAMADDEDEISSLRL